MPCTVSLRSTFSLDRLTRASWHYIYISEQLLCRSLLALHPSWYSPGQILHFVLTALWPNQCLARQTKQVTQHNFHLHNSKTENHEKSFEFFSPGRSLVSSSETFVSVCRLFLFVFFWFFFSTCFPFGARTCWHACTQHCSRLCSDMASPHVSTGQIWYDVNNTSSELTTCMVGRHFNACMEGLL